MGSSTWILVKSTGPAEAGRRVRDRRRDELQRDRLAAARACWLIISSGTVTVCDFPSSTTAIGVIWLPTTTSGRVVDELREHPRRVGRPAGVVPGVGDGQLRRADAERAARSR